MGKVDWTFFLFFFLQTGKKWIGALISRNLCEILTATLWKWKARWVETWKPCLVVVWVDRIWGGIKIIIIMINVHMAVPSRSRSWSDGVQPTPHNYFRFPPRELCGESCRFWMFLSCSDCLLLTSDPDFADLTLSFPMLLWVVDGGGLGRWVMGLFLKHLALQISYSNKVSTC